MVLAAASMTAASVPGRIGCHSTASRGASRSARTGLKFTNLQPRRASSASAGRTRCSEEPPGDTCAFFAGMPPKQTMRRVCSCTVLHEWCCIMSSSIEATMCGITTRAAPRL